MGPPASGSAKVIVRGLGPSLPLARGLLDPTLELHNGDGEKIAVNDDWKNQFAGQAQEDEFRATNLAPTDDRESVILGTLTRLLHSYCESKVWRRGRGPGGGVLSSVEANRETNPGSRRVPKERLARELGCARESLRLYCS